MPVEWVHPKVHSKCNVCWEWVLWDFRAPNNEYRLFTARLYNKNDIFLVFEQKTKKLRRSAILSETAFASRCLRLMKEQIELGDINNF